MNWDVLHFIHSTPTFLTILMNCVFHVHNRLIVQAYKVTISLNERVRSDFVMELHRMLFNSSILGKSSFVSPIKKSITS